MRRRKEPFSSLGGLMVQKVAILSNLSIKENGLGLGDRLELTPLNARKRTLKLMKTHYKFVIRQGVEYQQKGEEIWLPGLKEEEGEFSLDLWGEGKDHDKRYLLRALSSNYFKVNEQWCAEVFLQRYSTIYLGFNRIETKNNLSHSKKSDDDEIDKRELFFEKWGQSNLPLLLKGETGSGKSHMAKSIANKLFPEKKFIHINISSFSPSLLESELFGHEKGAFTGAHQNKLGALRESHYGVLYLDEIDSLSLELQTKLLLFFDNNEVRPVGGARSYPVQNKLIISTGRSLDDLLKAGKIRSDFYFRLHSGLEFELGPLRQRLNSIQEILDLFMVQHKVHFSRQLTQFILNYSWPGNYRQLMGYLKKKALLEGPGYLDVSLIDENLLNIKKLNSMGELEVFRPLEEVKNDYIKRAYISFDQKVDMVSNVLKISPYKIKNALEDFKGKEREAFKKVI